MPYSKEQQQAACIALAAKRGKIPVSKLKGPSLGMFNSMSEKELEDFCKGPIKRPRMSAR